MFTAFYCYDSICVLQSNILIDDLGQPRISNLGLEAVSDLQVAELYKSTTKGDESVRWQAPELLNPSRFGSVKAGPTTTTDVYAFACLCIEVSIMALSS